VRGLPPVRALAAEILVQSLPPTLSAFLSGIRIDILPPDIGGGRGDEMRERVGVRG